MSDLRFLLTPDECPELAEVVYYAIERGCTRPRLFLRESDVIDTTTKRARPALHLVLSVTVKDKEVVFERALESLVPPLPLIIEGFRRTIDRIVRGEG